MTNNMNGVVGLRFIGNSEDIAVVLSLLTIALAGTGARLVNGDNRYRTRTSLTAVRVYAEVVLPSDLPDEGVQ
ncbi:hypothetical protein GZH49_36255 [Nocardia terpenica]|uniref:hypothetical protein n=1 Tax=Nocardia terpenica TaxID=455432 RepID=UPI002FE1A1B9